MGADLVANNIVDDAAMGITGRGIAVGQKLYPRPEPGPPFRRAGVELADMAGTIRIVIRMLQDVVGRGMGMDVIEQNQRHRRSAFG